MSELHGVLRVRASAQTENVLVQFDRSSANEQTIVRALGDAVRALRSSDREGKVAPRQVVRETGRNRSRARIAVRGLDRDPELARRLVGRLSGIHGVSRVSASQLTGRVLVEYADHLLTIEDLLSEITGLELPQLPDEEPPSHPLDPAPLIQSTARVVGSSLGLALTALRRGISDADGARGGGAGAKLAGTVGIIEGLHPIEQRLEEHLGRNAAQLALSGMTIVSLSFAGSPLGLAVSGASALGLMSAMRSRRESWTRYEERIADSEEAHPGAEVTLEAGDRVPLSGKVVSGFGTALSAEGAVVPASPGVQLDAGARIFGGPLRIELAGDPAFTPDSRSPPTKQTLFGRYLSAVPTVSLGYAAIAGLLARSPGRALTALLLVNPRAALLGAESADNAAERRVLRQGVTVVGSRRDRPLRRPDAMIIDPARVLIAGFEVADVVPADPAYGVQEVREIAAAVSAAAGSPWGSIFRRGDSGTGIDGTFDGRVASAELEGERWLLAQRGRSHNGRSAEPVLEVRQARSRKLAGTITLRPVPAVGLEQLRETCRHYGVEVEVARGDALVRVRKRQARGEVVAVLSDSAAAAAAFAQSHLAVALSSGRSGRFAARADFLAPNLASVAAIIEAGARRDAAVRDAVIASSISNVAGAAWGLGGTPRFERGSQATYVAALAAIASSHARLRGGGRARSVMERLSDPEPERFGRMSVEEALSALRSRPGGLTASDAASRARPHDEPRRGAVGGAILDQLNSPLTAVLGGGAALSFALGAVADVAMIGAVIVVNTAVGAWQEHQAGRAAEALARMSARRASVLRDGELRTVGADELVPGDVILLGAGDRVPADARLIESSGLEVDEAALTGESVPVAKSADNGIDASRIVLEGSDVTVGTARAVVVAVGGGTRMGATAAAIALEETRASPLGQRLGRMFSEGLPLIVAGGLLVTAAGVLWGRPLIPQLALGASVAVGAVPEGLPLLAGVAQAAVARRLSARRALVRRLSAVEAFGRVDVACTDKTGTLTEGRPAVTCVCDARGKCVGPAELAQDLRQVLEGAAIASPHPDAPSLSAHPTDVAVVEAAQRAGVREMRECDREAEASFEPARGFHATRANDQIFVKGAAEVLVPRCTRVHERERDVPLRATVRDALLNTAEALSARGLRVLMVCRGPADASVEDPKKLTALGFVGISDPLRPGVQAAVRRCEAAGVRVMMLTGDHPATARAIAQEAGLARNGVEVLTGDELAELDDEALDNRLDGARVIARISPLDKLRIVEALQRRQHVVAMTGDGVNDAPALRLADVGVAMGRSGTDVAREAADVVLADDDFSTLVETLVEGRGFWHNIRRALALLLGGNAGELGLMVAAGVAGLPAPLTTRQVLAVNLVTDVFPALSVAVQEPEHRDLAGLAREGTAALDAPLRREILNRGIATSLPSFGAYLLASRGDASRRRAVAFVSIVMAQLAQTLDLGRSEGQMNSGVMRAVFGSAAFVAAAVSVPPLRQFLGLAVPTPIGLGLCSAATLASVMISRRLSREVPATTPR